MCAAFEVQGKKRRPGMVLGGWSETGPVYGVWAGFARQETLGWWRRQGGRLVDVPADRFAERSDADRRLIWADVPGGRVLRAWMPSSAPGAAVLLKIVTRPASAAELAHFGHDRMPVIEPAQYGTRALDVPENSRQGELFGSDTLE
jgi:hypothetical protein